MIILLCILSCAVAVSGTVIAQTNRAEGTNSDIYLGRYWIEDHPLTSIVAIEDSYVLHSFPDSNYDSAEYLQIRWQSGDTPETIDKIWLKFSLASLDPHLNYTAAYLSLYTYDDSTNDPLVTVMPCSNDGWSEDTITYNNQPTHEISIQDWQTIYEGIGDQYLWDITDCFLTELNGDKTLSLVLNTTTDYSYTRFNSLDSGTYQPTIYIYEDASHWTSYSGLAFQCLPGLSDFIALYTVNGALNTTENEFYINSDGGGIFSFVSNENFSFQCLKSVSANIEGDQGNSIRGMSASSTGLTGVFNVNAGDRVTIYWIPVINYYLALPLISFWGMVGGALIGSVFTGAAIKKRNFNILIVGLIAFLAALIFYLIFTGA